MSSKPSKPKMAKGELLNQRYLLEEKLGSGGVGSVFQALDTQLDHVVAIKFLRPELSTDERQRHRFLREFRAISRLNHPNCLKVFDEGSDRGLYYFVMEHIRGGDLSDLLEASPYQKLCALFQITAALAYIHSLRIVHRDLKPANILLGQGEHPVPKLADFGLAKIETSNTNAKSAVTKVGEMIGTMAYMSPEQIRGESVDPRTDLYALGCLIYYLWSGQPPFVADDPNNFFEVLCSHLDKQPIPLQERTPEAPLTLQILAQRLLEKSPSDRPQSALEVLQVLQEELETFGPLPQHLIEAIPSEESEAFLFSPPLIGREQELNWLLEKAETILNNQDPAPPIIVISGETGVGKTHLLDTLRTHFSEKGIHIINAWARQDAVQSLSPFEEIEDEINELALALRKHPPSNTTPVLLRQMDSHSSQSLDGVDASLTIPASAGLVLDPSLLAQLTPNNAHEPAAFAPTDASVKAISEHDLDLIESEAIPSQSPSVVVQSSFDQHQTSAEDSIPAGKTLLTDESNLLTEQLKQQLATATTQSNDSFSSLAAVAPTANYEIIPPSSKLLSKDELTSTTQDLTDKLDPPKEQHASIAKSLDPGKTIPSNFQLDLNDLDLHPSLAEKQESAQEAISSSEEEPVSKQEETLEPEETLESEEKQAATSPEQEESASFDVSQSTQNLMGELSSTLGQIDSILASLKHPNASSETEEVTDTAPPSSQATSAQEMQAVSLEDLEAVAPELLEEVVETAEDALPQEVSASQQDLPPVDPLSPTQTLPPSNISALQTPPSNEELESLIHARTDRLALDDIAELQPSAPPKVVIHPAHIDEWGEDPAMLPTNTLSPELLAQLNSSVEIDIEQLNKQEQYTQRAHASTEDAVSIDPKPVGFTTSQIQRATLLSRRLGFIASKIYSALLIENFHDASPGAFAYLNNILNALPQDSPSQPCIVLTVKPGESRQKLEQILNKHHTYAILDLQRLQDQDIEQLIFALLGLKEEQTKERSNVQPLLQTLLPEAAGLPLFAKTYIQALIDEQQLIYKKNHWQPSETFKAAPPRNMEEVVFERVEKLPETVRSTLQMAAVIGQDFGFKLLQQLTGLPADTLLDVVDKAIHARVIKSVQGRSSEDAYTFESGNIAVQLYTALSPEERQTIHHTIGTLLEQETAPPLSQLAYHFGQSDDLERAVLYTQQAGEAALKEKDYTSAIAHFQAGFRQLPAGTQQRNLRIWFRKKLAHAHFENGDTDEAIDHYQQLLKLIDSPTEQTETYRMLGECYFRKGQLDEGVTHIQHALELLGDKLPTGKFSLKWRSGWESLVRGWGSKQDTDDPEKLRTRARLHVSLLERLYWSDGERFDTHAFAYLQLANKLDDPSMKLDAEAIQLTRTEYINHPAKLAQLETKLQGDAAAIHDLKALTRLHTQVGIASFCYSDITKTLRSLQLALQLANQQGDRELLCRSLHTWAWFRVFLSQWDDALQDFSYISTLSQELDNPVYQTSALCGLALTSFMKGESQQAREYAQSALTKARAQSLQRWELIALHISAADAFFQRQFKKASRLFEEAIELTLSQHLFSGFTHLLFFNHMESLLWQLDTKSGSEAEIIQQLKRNQKLSKQYLHEFPIFQGFIHVLQGTLYARQNRIKYAQKSFQLALETRNALKKHYFSGWMMQRVAIELSHLKDNPNIIQTLLDKSLETLSHTQATQLIEWHHWVRQQIL